MKPLGAAEDAVQRQRVRRRRGHRGARRSAAHRGRAGAQHRGPRVHGQGARGARLQAADSQGNFLFVDIGRPAKEFRDACAKQGVMVGRDFPPFEKTHCRISIGTMEEMKKATDGLPRRAENADDARRRERREVGAMADTTHIRPDRRHRRGGRSAWIGARGRENSLWAAFEPTLEAVDARRDLPVEQREPARARARPCSTAVKAAFGPTGARAGPLRRQRRRAHRRDREEAGGQAGEHRPRLRLDPDSAHRRRTSSPRRTSRSSARSRPTRSAPATPR